MGYSYNRIVFRNEVLLHATIWMNLGDIVLREIIQSQKTMYYMVSLTQNV